MARVDFQSRVPIGTVRIGEQLLPVLPTAEMTRQLRIVRDSVNSVESGLTASEVSFVPAGSVAATNLQAALEELDSEKGTATSITAHTTNTSNPHSTTAAQVGAVATNAAIVAATKTKITYDTKGLVTAGADATTADIADSAGRRYLTDAERSDVQALGTISTQDASNVSITGGTIGLASGSLGYATGNGGTVTQITNKATGVTLDKPSGEITMHNANLADGITVSFTLTNSTIAATDVLAMNVVSGATVGGYRLNAICSAGSASIQVTNQSGGALAEAIVIRFVVLKGAVS